MLPFLFGFSIGLFVIFALATMFTLKDWVYACFIGSSVAVAIILVVALLCLGCAKTKYHTTETFNVEKVYCDINKGEYTFINNDGIKTVDSKDVFIVDKSGAKVIVKEQYFSNNIVRFFMGKTGVKKYFVYSEVSVKGVIK